MATSPLCKIPGCNKPSRSRGWCNPHYQRFYRLGDPLAGGPSKPPNGTLLRFLQGIADNPPEHCVIWPFSRGSGGYGFVTWRGRKTTAHRAVWEIYQRREMQPGNQAAHEPIICHNRACVNPLHIREATCVENHADKVLDDTHNRGSRQWRSKLTEDQVIAIRADSRLQREIAVEYGVSQATVSEIKSGRRWAWL